MRGILVELIQVRLYLQNNVLIIFEPQETMALKNSPFEGKLQCKTKNDLKGGGRVKNKSLLFKLLVLLVNLHGSGIGLFVALEGRE